MGKHGETIIYVNIQFIQWFIIIMSSSIDQGLDSRSLLEKVEPHAEVTWLRPAEIWSRYLGESEEHGRNPCWLMISWGVIPTDIICFFFLKWWIPKTKGFNTKMV